MASFFNRREIFFIKFKLDFQGKICILDIDVQGVKAVSRIKKKSSFIRRSSSKTKVWIVWNQIFKWTYDLNKGQTVDHHDQTTPKYIHFNGIKRQR